MNQPDPGLRSHFPAVGPRDTEEGSRGFVAASRPCGGRGPKPSPTAPRPRNLVPEPPGALSVHKSSAAIWGRGRRGGGGGPGRGRRRRWRPHVLASATRREGPRVPDVAGPAGLHARGRGGTVGESAAHPDVAPRHRPGARPTLRRVQGPSGVGRDHGPATAPRVLSPHPFHFPRADLFTPNPTALSVNSPHFSVASPMTRLKKARLVQGGQGLSGPTSSAPGLGPPLTAPRRFLGGPLPRPLPVSRRGPTCARPTSGRP